MSVDNVEVTQTEVADTQNDVVDNRTQENSYEAKARELGWKPKDEFYGDDDAWVDAKEFVQRKPLFDAISRLNKETGDMRKALKLQHEHFNKQREAQLKQHEKELRAAKIAALNEGNAELVVELDDQLNDIREAKAEHAEQSKEAPAPSAEFVAFYEKNPWYTKDRELSSFAEQLGERLVSEGMGLSQVFETLHKEVRKRYPEKFGRTTPPANAVVSGASSPATKQSADTTFNAKWKAIPADERRVIEKMCEISGMTKEQYLEETEQYKKSA